jgi:hypothetical protein
VVPPGGGPPRSGTQGSCRGFPGGHSRHGCRPGPPPRRRRPRHLASCSGVPVRGRIGLVHPRSRGAPTTGRAVTERSEPDGRPNRGWPRILTRRSWAPSGADCRDSTGAGESVGERDASRRRAGAGNVPGAAVRIAREPPALATSRNYCDGRGCLGPKRWRAGRSR